MRVTLLILCCALFACPKPPTPKTGPTEEGPRYGALMVEVGHRFEFFGRAVKARRYDLAAFELQEMGEVFEEDLPKAEAPREVPPGVNLAGLRDAFVQTNLPELEESMHSKDEATIAAAFKSAAETCNGCHQASGDSFVEIPTELGAAVPRLDPLP